MWYDIWCSGNIISYHSTNLSIIITVIGYNNREVSHRFCSDLQAMREYTRVG